ncbi:hypothetical protein PHAVU_001G142400 [Phaseolus vulgaris]|uniref:protein-serine/threonine phosphatase n=2 Tax=Phaseolus vulgaris TaxID=3885 RepID=V7CY63_PHAVU|nr:hypothetical protein PHAVU_001G142400g [Phaseolus vulgaris]ESW34318.1 hypothetical protein PHAVU_001G142400g [Phaseolus vulgaris]
MFTWISNIVFSCFNSLRHYARMDSDDEDESSSTGNSLMWRRDLQRHSCGEFSFAVCQANGEIEDYSQVEIGSNVLFVGIYDGHGGPEASRFIRNRIFQHIIRIAQESRTLCEGTLREAIAATEDDFMTIVSRSFRIDSSMAQVGSCVLVGLIWRGILYIANLGDSRAVVGCAGRCNSIIAEQLTRDHNVGREDIRQELRALHPNDPDIVVMNRGAWRVKGIIQVSRTIGDAYLKTPPFSLDPTFPHIPSGPLAEPVLSAEPSLFSRILQPNDKFLIFASDGLWEHLSNQKAAEIVNRYPRNGIARRLVKTALKEAARRARMEYRQLLNVKEGARRVYHDDITVIVIFLRQEADVNVPELSVRAFVDASGPSSFRTLGDLLMP